MKLVDKEKFLSRWRDYGFKNLLIWLLAYILITPFMESLPHASTLMSIFLTAVLLSAICAVDFKAPHLPLTVVFMTLALATLWLNRASVITITPVIFSVVEAFYFGILSYSFLRHLLRVRRVTGNVICAALCLYLVIGLLWGAFYQILDVVSPGALSGNLLEAAHDPHIRDHTLNYFSFVTLSTLGYGDITPQTQGAAALCQAEAILGQFFAIALVARLVGIQVAQQAAEEEEEEKKARLKDADQEPSQEAGR